VLIAAFCCCYELGGCEDCGGSKDSVAFRGAKRAKAGRVMLHAFLESLDASVFVLTIVGV